MARHTMLYDVTVHITPNLDRSFLVTGSMTGRGGGALNRRVFFSAVALRGFLSGDLGIHIREVHAAVESVRAGGACSILHVMLTAEQIAAHGLGPIGH
jgi:hypothetical protein